MERTMINNVNNLYEEGKKSLDTLLREKAYEDVVDKLTENGIDINNVKEQDIESLVQAKVDDMKNGIKGFAAGAAFSILFTSLIGF